MRSAVVRREFPNRLHVTLTEQVPVATWGDDAGSKLINGFGDVFEANVAEVDDNLPRLDGPIEQAGQVLGMYRVLQPQFQPYDLGIDELTLSSRGSWKVVLDSGAEIELGRGQSEEVTARLQRFLKTVTQVAGQYRRTVADVEGADLRHNDAYALRLRGVTTVSPEAPRKSSSEYRGIEDISMPKEYKDLVVGLDIGTAKVMVVVAECCPAASSSWPASASRRATG